MKQTNKTLNKEYFSDFVNLIEIEKNRVAKLFYIGVAKPVALEMCKGFLKEISNFESSEFSKKDLDTLLFDLQYKFVLKDFHEKNRIQIKEVLYDNSLTREISLASNLSENEKNLFNSNFINFEGLKNEFLGKFELCLAYQNDTKKDFIKKTYDSFLNGNFIPQKNEIEPIMHGLISAYLINRQHYIPENDNPEDLAIKTKYKDHFISKTVSQKYAALRIFSKLSNNDNSFDYAIAKVDFNLLSANKYREGFKESLLKLEAFFNNSLSDNLVTKKGDNDFSFINKFTNLNNGFDALINDVFNNNNLGDIGVDLSFGTRNEGRY